MAARRLVIALVVLLLVSTGVAIVAGDPEPESREADTKETTDATFDPDEAGWPSPPGNEPGRTLRRLVRTGGEVESIETIAGDRLILTVAGPEPSTVEIPGLGRDEALDPAAPARFDILLSEAGEFSVQTVGGPDRVAVIHVARPSASQQAMPSARSNAQTR